jgi:hypothetical protein
MQRAELRGLEAVEEGEREIEWNVIQIFLYGRIHEEKGSPRRIIFNALSRG